MKPLPNYKPILILLSILLLSIRSCQAQSTESRKLTLSDSVTEECVLKVPRTMAGFKNFYNCFQNHRMPPKKFQFTPLTLYSFRQKKNANNSNNVVILCA